MSKSIRIRTTPNGDDKYLNLNLEQDFDFVEILSLKITQKELYTKFCADYGVIVGRVTVNNGFGVPNAKVSVFVPISEDDKLDPEIYGEYPFETISDNDGDGTRYNLLSSNNDTNNECFTPVGSFPNKREFIDNDGLLDIYCKYYKFTTTTNDAGDYMIFGVPAGSHIMYAEADMSDIGHISQKPYDYIRQGSTEENFDSTTKFKKEKNLDAMNHIINRSPVGVDVQPFWGDKDMCNVMITRRDVDLKVRIVPNAIFIGSIFGDGEENSINTRCRPRTGMGVLDGQTAGSGKIEMIRKTISGGVERFDVKGGQVIDKDGTWAYQVPMNLDYRITDEYGDLVPSDDPNKGLPTKAKVRFRIGMDVTGGEGKLRTRGKYLVPHNPQNLTDVDYTFGSQTKASSLAELSWNTIYTVKNYIPRYEHTDQPSKAKNRSFIGIKDVDSARGKYTPFPFDRLFIASDSLFNFICGLVVILAGIIILINSSIIWIINKIIRVINAFGAKLDYLPCITMECMDSDYAPGCNLNAEGCEAANGPPVGSTYCVGSTSENDWGDTDVPGDAGYVNCVAMSLVEDLNLLKYDFYNDWVNGTLYSPLFKYKRKKIGTGREKFCEGSCGGYDGGVNNLDPNDPNAYDNDCYEDTYFKDICVSSNDCNTDQTGTNRSNEGLIQKTDDTLYYAPYSRNVGRLMLATDIISLGSSVKCHYDATPMVQSLFIDTTYQMPPLLAEYSLINGQLVMTTNGIDSPSKEMQYSLFVDVSCIDIEARSQQCGNLSRQCELGVGLDDLSQDANGNLNPPGSPAPAELTNADIDVRFNREVFAWLNNETLRLANPNPVDLDVDWVGAPNCAATIGTSDYNTFRYEIPNYTFGTHISPRTKNSFYFYFGLNAASTALTKLREKYFAPCPILEDNNFVVIGDVTPDTSGTTQGAIDVTVIGGVGPYTYYWSGPNGYSQTLTPTLGAPDAGDIDGLDGGVYTLTVVDAGGNATTTTFVVDAPLPLTCTLNVAANPTFSGNTGNFDGILNYYINGGSPDYTVTVLLNNAPYAPPTTSQQTQYTFTGLGVGEYTVEVTDGAGNTCTQIIELLTDPPLDFVINSSYTGTGDTENPINYVYVAGTGNPSCANVDNGFINVQPLGGTGPYSVAVYDDVLLTNVISTNFYTGNLAPNTYYIVVTDSVGNYTTTSTITFTYPPAYTVDATGTNPSSIGGTDGTVTITALGGVGPYDFYITGQNPVFNEDSPYTFEGLPEGTYDFYVIDITGCQSLTVTGTLVDPS